MKKIRGVMALLLVAATSSADDLSGVDSFLCATNTVRLCFETGDCYPVLPSELNFPNFIIVDTKRKEIRTTEASGMDRSTAFKGYDRREGVVTVQGMEGGRAFSFLIEEQSGFLTASIARDGFAASAFGSCTVGN